MNKAKKCHIRWTDKEVLEWATEYVNTKSTIEELEEKLKVSHSTISWNFIHRLPRLDRELYELVMLTMEANLMHKGPQGPRKTPVTVPEKKLIPETKENEIEIKEVLSTAEIIKPKYNSVEELLADAPFLLNKFGSEVFKICYECYRIGFRDGKNITRELLEKGLG